MKTLAIETSCDDTSLAIVSYEDGGVFEVEKLIAYSQIAEHTKFGGVLPEIASRLHSEKIIALVQEIGWEEIKKTDFISVTTHPGLPGSLIVGKAVANMLGEYFDKEVVEVNHIYGHIFSILLDRKLSDIELPMVILTASGGHNDIYIIKEKGKRNEEKEKLGFNIQKLGWTLDDASGEAFDKVSKMLGGPYPGGPWISQMAEKGKSNEKYKFKRIFLPVNGENLYPFSFSGMKSQVSFLLDKIKKAGQELSNQDVYDIAYEFQEAMVEILVKRLGKAGKENDVKTIAVAGGVSANNRLERRMAEGQTPPSFGSYIRQSPPLSRQIGTSLRSLIRGDNKKILFPAKKVYSTDNGAMIGVVGILERMGKSRMKH